MKTFFFAINVMLHGSTKYWANGPLTIVAKKVPNITHSRRVMCLRLWWDLQL